MPLMRKKLFMAVVLTLLFCAALTSWAFERLWLEIPVLSDTLENGRASKIVTLPHENVYSVKRGRPHRLSGLALYRIEVSKPEYVELAQIYFTSSAEGPLAKIRWWVETALYYEVASGGERVLSDGTQLRRFPADSATAYLNRTDADELLMTGGLIPTDGDDATSRTTIYVIASFVNPGGKIPPGQVGALTELLFHCMVRL